jgi:hypothetical protein
MLKSDDHRLNPRSEGASRRKAALLSKIIADLEPEAPLTVRDLAASHISADHAGDYHTTGRFELGAWSLIFMRIQGFVKSASAQPGVRKLMQANSNHETLYLCPVALMCILSTRLGPILRDQEFASVDRLNG